MSVKKEPGSNPCQVAEITTSVSPVVKLEVASPTQKCGADSQIVNGAALPTATGKLHFYISKVNFISTHKCVSVLFGC